MSVVMMAAPKLSHMWALLKVACKTYLTDIADMTELYVIQMRFPARIGPAKNS